MRHGRMYPTCALSKNTGRRIVLIMGVNQMAGRVRRFVAFLPYGDIVTQIVPMKTSAPPPNTFTIVYSGPNQSKRIRS